jgi:hypothetical protein
MKKLDYFSLRRDVFFRHGADNGIIMVPLKPLNKVYDFPGNAFAIPATP